jgi:ferredoxin
MRYSGPALISVYSGARTTAAEEDGAPSYLLAAAAMESRVFPAFSYDPGAGADWAARFTLEGNPQPEADWPRHEFAWIDENQQRHLETLPFTLADFAVCDARFARHFARVPREHWNASMVGVSEWLARPDNGVPETVPCISAIDAEGRLQRLIVDEKLVHAARVCAQAWKRLQELDRLKRKEMPAAKEEKPEARQETKAKEEPQPEPAQEKREPGDPYIETERCSSCNECTNLNNRMFAYNDNKQAYIKDPDAGSFKELVEAAESCQVAVIHPGKPRNPKEPGLDELVKRAEPFQ